MKRLVIGILAHVDAGKTTLSEGLLYNAGEIAHRGRVDYGDTFLDTNEIERERGITIFSKQAQIHLKNSELTLLDTPGHVDFSAEAERTLQVLDYAVLVISGGERVQSHTETLWRLLEHYDIPTFLFINKMDLPSANCDEVMADLTERLGDGFVDFGGENYFESAALCSEQLLEEYTQKGSISSDAIKNAIAARQIFPCFFGSALKNEGVGEFLQSIDELTIKKNYPKDFAARVYKLGEDEKGRRLTYMKITGGSLKIKDNIEGDGWCEKANDIRIYSGERYKSVQQVYAGSICAVAGLGSTYAGEGLGTERSGGRIMTEPVFSYSVRLAPGTDIHYAREVFAKLEQEEPQLSVIWSEQLQKIDVRMMGEVQMEVLRRILADRFGMEVEFEHGSIIYKETIANRVEGVGHYEPLRHYAEVHLLIEPGESGSGVVLRSKCSEDILDKNWQRLILTHLAEKQHRGVLTGAPITDVKITLTNGKAHKKHTEGGDFRQATYRAVRQGLMQAESVLLEPWYNFNLEMPTENIGRAMTDLQQLGALIAAPETDGELSRITGSAPIAGIRDYHRDVTAYTHGRGRLSCTFGGYKPCTNQDAVVSEIGYNAEADLENTPDSVFCSHGSGFLVKWNEVFQYMHLPLADAEKPQTEPVTHTVRRQIADEEELLRIFEQTYGKIKQRTAGTMRVVRAEKPYKSKPLPTGPEYLLIDGYNIIFAWDSLSKLAEESLDDARRLLCDRICSYQAMRKNNVIVVFDAYKVKGCDREVEKMHGISIVYTKEAETADAYIEKTTKQLSRTNRVRVATSDNLEQMIIFGHGARRVTASELLDEVESAENEIREFIEQNNGRE